MLRISCNLKHALRTGTALASLAVAIGLMATPAHAIVGNDNYPPDTLVDTTNITGVGQMVIDLQTGYVGLCTASLINPRTVILAAHCVNEEPANTYGAAFGGMAIGFGFQADNLNPTINWFGSGYQTSEADAFYNSNYVVYNQHSLDLGPGLNFLQSDIAMAALDTPAVGIPTWTLLLSPLTAQTHGTITGYGNYGTGTDGYLDLDFRRRVAENIISMLGSLDDTDSFLFGSPDGLPQNLYMMDFNDPKFGTAAANVYDFNIFHDAALQKEGITAPGDSGGPLIVDQLYSQPVIAAVLSGSQRFFGGQPEASYGTIAFYQPLYLFWDWIVANNPYKYVSAKEGDGSWTDPDHWVINLDPSYVIDVDGELVNALPSDPAQGTPPIDGVNTPKFGEVCYYDICQNIVTGEITGAGTVAAQNLVSQYGASPATVALSALAQNITTQPSSGTSALTNMRAMLESRGTIAPMSAAEGSAIVAGQTITGAPGASGFVPDDTDGNPADGIPARYYDVTLAAAGTTTLGTGSVIIDRLTINGPETGLTIGEDAGMGTLIDTTMYAGNFQVDGLYISVGDFGLMGGVLSGNGMVVAPYTTAVLGAIAPGTVDTTGQLTVAGNVVMASGSGLLIDVSPADNDLLDVYGTLSLGGTLVVSPVGGYVPTWHEERTIAYGDTIEGAFDNVPDTITGVLYPVAVTATIGTGASAYQAEMIRFDAASFLTLLDNPTGDQQSVAGGLDGARGGHYGDMQDLYDAIDPLDGTTLSNALTNLVPHTARTAPQSALLMTQAYTGYLWQYFGGMNEGGQGLFAVRTDTLKLAQYSNAGSFETRGLMTTIGMMDRGPGSAAAPASPLPAEGGTMSLPKGMGGFLSGQVLDGKVTVGGSGGKASIDGYLVAFGLDMPFSDRFRAGLSFAISEAKATLEQQPAVTNTSMKEVVLYGRYDFESGVFVNGFFGGGFLTNGTARDVVVGSSTFHITGHNSGTNPLFGLQVGTLVNVDSAEILPAAGLQYSRPDMHGYTETGGSPAMTISPYGKKELDARVGFDARMSFKTESADIRPNLHLFYVASLDRNKNAALQSTFAVDPNNPMTFALPSTSVSWAEIGVGLDVGVWDCASIGVHYNVNPGREDAYFSSWGGAIRIDY